MIGEAIKMYLRGLVFTIAAVIALTIVYGVVAFVVLMPSVGVPLMVLVILPLLFGGVMGATE